MINLINFKIKPKYKKSINQILCQELPDIYDRLQNFNLYSTV